MLPKKELKIYMYMVAFLKYIFLIKYPKISERQLFYKSSNVFLHSLLHFYEYFKIFFFIFLIVFLSYFYFL